MAQQLNLFDPSLRPQRQWLTPARLVALLLLLVAAMVLLAQLWRREAVQLQARTAPFYSTYQTADQRWLAVGPLEAPQLPPYLRRLEAQSAFHGQSFAQLQLAPPPLAPGQRASEAVLTHHVFALRSQAREAGR